MQWIVFFDPQCYKNPMKKPSSCSKCKLLILLIIFLILPLGIKASERPIASEALFTLDKEFTKEQRTIIDEDLNFLSGLSPWKKLSKETLWATDFTGERAEDHKSWLKDRVKFLLRKSTDNALLFFGSNHGLLFPYPEVLPNDMENLYTVENDYQQVMMANLGVAYYLFGKIRKQLISIDFEGRMPGITKQLAITGPRVGLVEVKEDFFKKQVSISGKGNRASDRVLRLSFLFHEGRHSDGHGESLGFFHTTCPEGHDYAGRLACDTPINGAYQISASFIKKTMEVCEDCTEKNKEALRLAYFDAKNRILDQKVITATERDFINRLENKMNTLVTDSLARFQNATDEEKDVIMSAIEDLERRIHDVKNGKFKKVYWNSEPEQIKMEI